MENWGSNLLYVAWPYLAIAIALTGTIYRFAANRFSWSSQSAEFLENKTLFFGSVPWHYGILVVLFGHFLALIIPQSIVAWNADPVRLYILELVGLAFGLLALIGLLVLAFRRFTDARVKKVSTTADVILILVLLIQVVLGVVTAIFYRWGSNWLAGSLSTWMWDLILLRPNAALVASLPVVVQLHIINAFVIIAIIPFTRLVHILAMIGPFKYLFGRPYQLVRWYNKAPATPDLSSRQLK